VGIGNARKFHQEKGGGGSFVFAVADKGGEGNEASAACNAIAASGRKVIGRRSSKGIFREGGEDRLIERE